MTENQGLEATYAHRGVAGTGQLGASEKNQGLEATYSK